MSDINRLPGKKNKQQLINQIRNKAQTRPTLPEINTKVELIPKKKQQQHQPTTSYKETRTPESKTISENKVTSDLTENLQLVQIMKKLKEELKHCTNKFDKISIFLYSINQI